MTELYAVLPLSPLRKIIATGMTEAKRTMPHFQLPVDIEMGALLP